MPLCAYCKKEFAEISLGKGGHDWLTCSEKTVERLRADRAKVHDWIREPDFAENASLEWLLNWVNRRPLAETR